jgi:hypothetical protein
MRPSTSARLRPWFAAGLVGLASTTPLNGCSEQEPSILCESDDDCPDPIRVLFRDFMSSIGCLWLDGEWAAA